jgi:hypothetical protein
MRELRRGDPLGSPFAVDRTGLDASKDTVGYLTVALLDANAV